MDTNLVGAMRPLTLSALEAANLLGVHRATFWRWQAAGIVPQPTIKRGRRVRWALADIEACARGEALPERQV